MVGPRYGKIRYISLMTKERSDYENGLADRAMSAALALLSLQILA